MANLDANGVTPAGGFPSFLDLDSPSEPTASPDPADFMRDMFQSMGERVPGALIDFNSAEYSKSRSASRNLYLQLMIYFPRMQERGRASGIRAQSLLRRY